MSHPLPCKIREDPPLGLIMSDMLPEVVGSSPHKPKNAKYSRKPVRLFRLWIMELCGRPDEVNIPESEYSQDRRLRHLANAKDFGKCPGLLTVVTVE